MISLLLPVAVGLLGGAAFLVATKKAPAEMTPARQVVLDTALSSTKDPDKLRALAKVFRDEGLTLQADLLDKRAALRELPDDVKEGRREAFRAGMASSNAVAIRNLANEFEKEGATGAAAALRKAAFDLEHAPVPGTGRVDGHGTGVIPDSPPGRGFPGAGLGIPGASASDPATIAAANMARLQAEAQANLLRLQQMAQQQAGGGTVDGHGTGVMFDEGPVDRSDLGALAAQPSMLSPEAQAAILQASRLAQTNEALGDPTSTEALAAQAAATQARVLAQAAHDAAVAADQNGGS